MNKQTSSASRRKLLKSIATGSGVIVAGKTLPENWTKPVVDSVMLPVHAQTSCMAMSITASSIISGFVRTISIWDSSNTNLSSDSSASPATITASISGSPAGTYIVGMSVDAGIPVNATISVTTNCSSLTVTQTINGGAGRVGMVEIILPAGTLQEVRIIPFP